MPYGPSMTLIRDVRIVPIGGVTAPHGRVDLRLRDGRLSAVEASLTPERGEEVHDGGGRWAMPGLWDQHVHMGQWVLMSMRLDTAAVRSPEEACALVRDAVAGMRPGETLQGWGHRSATWSRRPRVAELDAVSGGRPVVLISGDGHHGWMNSMAMAMLGVPARDGVVEEAEWFALYPRLMELPGVAQGMERRYAGVVRAANALGVTGVVDMEFAHGYLDWPRRFAGVPGCDPVDTLRVRAAIYEEGLSGVLGAELRTGDSLLPGRGEEPGGPMLTMGPLKVIADGSLNTRTAYCCEPFADAHEDQEPCGVQNVAPERLTELMRIATRGGLEVAAHAIGDAAVRDVVGSFAESGARGSVEHAQLVRFEDVGRMADLDLSVSAQPAHLLDDRDVTDACWPDRGDRCFALRSMGAAGVDVRLGSDAPVSPLDPWLEIASAVHRSADAREAWHPEQALTVEQALACSTDGATTLAVGSLADVVLLDADPLAVPSDSREASAYLREMRVGATFVAGRLVASQ